MSAVISFFKWLASIFKKPSPPIPVPPPKPGMASQLTRGLTLEDVSDVPRIVKSLSAMPFRPTVRIVFHYPDKAKVYFEAVKEISKVATIVGQPCDSDYSKEMSVFEYGQRFQEYLNLLHPYIEIWEVGNEVNGDWLSKKSAEQTAAGLEIIKAWGKKSMLVPYWNTPSCADTNGGYLLWLQNNLSEYVKNNCDYVCTSFYGFDCDGPEPTHDEISRVLGQMAVTFYPARVGIGEYGKRNNASIMRHYLDYQPRVGVPYIEFGGYWHGSQDLLTVGNNMWNEFVKRTY